MIKGMKLIQRLLLLVLLGLALPVSAQLGTDFLGVQTELEVEPQFPEPGETVTVSFVNSGRFSGSDIVWSINGEVVPDANNRRELQFVAGELGQSAIVSVNVVRPSGVVEEYAAAITPTYVDIVFEPQTRIPDFYEGRGVPTIGSQINATVLVNNGQLLDDDYVYTWRLNGQILEGGPIRGTNTVSFDTPQGSRSTLIVSVANRNGFVVGRDAIYFQSERPEVYFYEFNSLHGQSHLAITDRLLLVGSAATVVAEPYYLDIRTYNNPDIIEWEIEDEVQTNTNTNPYRITIQKVEEGGESEVAFHVRNTTQLLMGARGDFNVVY
jgi:hypothetical protein